VIDDEDGSEAAFEEQLTLFKKCLIEEKVCYHGKSKMRPNVTTAWLNFVRECLQRRESQTPAN